jgi:hypothetical protein
MSSGVAVLHPAAADMDVDAPVVDTSGDEDLYSRYKALQRQLEFLEIQVRFDRIHGSFLARSIPSVQYLARY